MVVENVKVRHRVSSLEGRGDRLSPPAWLDCQVEVEAIVATLASIPASILLGPRGP